MTLDQATQGVHSTLGQWRWLDVKRTSFFAFLDQQTQNICIKFKRCRPKVFDVGHCLNVRQMFCVLWASIHMIQDEIEALYL